MNILRSTKNRLGWNLVSLVNYLLFYLRFRISKDVMLSRWISVTGKSMLNGLPAPPKCTVPQFPQMASDSTCPQKLNFLWLLQITCTALSLFKWEHSLYLTSSLKLTLKVCFPYYCYLNPANFQNDDRNSPTRYRGINQGHDPKGLPVPGILLSSHKQTPKVLKQCISLGNRDSTEPLKIFLLNSVPSSPWTLNKCWW